MYDLLNCDVLEGLRQLPDASVDCIVTSPPYWGLRDYGTPPVVYGGKARCKHVWSDHVRPAANGITHAKGMTGEMLNVSSATRKPTCSAYCKKCGAWRGQIGLEPTIAEFLQHMQLIFAECWRVLKPTGTMWVNMGDSYYSGTGAARAPGGGSQGKEFKGPQTQPNRVPGSCGSLRKKSLIGQPWRLAFALQDQGWILRRDIIWHKPAPMPESCKDRPTTAHEYIFMLTKEEKYFYDFDAASEPVTDSTIERLSQPTYGDQQGSTRANGGERPDRPMKALKPASGQPDIRNARSVWTIAKASYPAAHFATFPPELPRKCILAGCPEGGTVLDIFAGSGTTLAVAVQLGRKAIGIELNPEYCDLIRDRMSTVTGSLFVEGGLE